MIKKPSVKLDWNLIKNIDELHCFSEQWECLNNKIGGNIFNSFKWINNWLTVYWQPQWQLSVFVAYSQNNLVAIAPFYIQTSNIGYKLKKLVPLGQGESEDSEVSSEYCDLIINPTHEKQVMTELKDKLLITPIDQIIWKATYPNALISNFIFKNFNIPLKNSATRYIIKRDKWLLSSLSKNTRSRYKRSMNQLNKINAEFLWINQDQFNAYFLILSELHQKRWQSKGKKGAFHHTDFKKFHQQMIHNNSENNVAMSAITVGNQPIAIHYYLADISTLYFYQSGWDEVNYANYSLGMTLHLWSIQHCEHKYYDFMMGNMNDSYKGKFGCEKIPMTNIKINLSPKKVFLNKVINKIFNSLKTD